MKILLFGCNGQVGWVLQRSLSLLGELVALGRDSIGLCGDFANPEGIAATVRAVRPDVIVNAAAYTAVDQAESEPALAGLINAATPGVLAREALAVDALLVHYSTEYVFDGSGHSARDELAATAPLSVYGQTKLQGEQLIQASGCRHLIFRTSWVYGVRGENFVKSILHRAQTHESLQVVSDQWGAPTGADLLADVTALAIRHVATHPEHLGLYHCVSQGEVNRYAYAQWVLDIAQQLRPDGVWKATRVEPVTSAAFAQKVMQPAQRPLNSRLSTAKLQQHLGLQLPPWQQGVERMLQALLQHGSER